METLSSSDYFGESKSVSVLPRVDLMDFPEHDHDFHELFIVKSGCGLHYFNGRPQHISKGSVFYLRAGQAHGFDHSQDLCLTNVVFLPQRLKVFSLIEFLPNEADQYALPLSVGSSAISECERLFAMIHAEDRRGDPGSAAMVEALFCQLVILLWREQRRDLQASDGDTRLAALIRHMDRNMTEQIDFAELADQFEIPLRTLARRIVEVTGMSLSGFLMRTRLCHAMKRLVSSPDSVTDIAFACGFNDSSHFATRFHQEFGVSPSQFRKQRTGSLPTRS